MLDLLNAEVLEGTELKEVGGRESILTQHSHHQNDSALTVCKPSSINCEGQSHKATFY